jgi:hypothetical protein
MYIVPGVLYSLENPTSIVAPPRGQNVTRGGQSIDTLRARSLLARVRAGELPR